MTVNNGTSKAWLDYYARSDRQRRAARRLAEILPPEKSIIALYDLRDAGAIDVFLLEDISVTPMIDSASDKRHE